MTGRVRKDGGHATPGMANAVDRGEILSFICTLKAQPPRVASNTSTRMC